MSEANGVPYVESELYKIRHSAAHVMAEAVLEFFPEARLAIGPPIEDGFYYDFDLGKDENGKPRTFSPEDLEKIEAKMKALLKQNARFEPSTKTIEEAKQFFAGQPFPLPQVCIRLLNVFDMQLQLVGNARRIEALLYELAFARPPFGRNRNTRCTLEKFLDACRPQSIDDVAMTRNESQLAAGRMQILIDVL